MTSFGYALAVLIGAVSLTGAVLAAAFAVQVYGVFVDDMRKEPANYGDRIMSATTATFLACWVGILLVLGGVGAIAMWNWAGIW